MKKTKSLFFIVFFTFLFSLGLSFGQTGVSFDNPRTAEAAAVTCNGPFTMIAGSEGPISVMVQSSQFPGQCKAALITPAHGVGFTTEYGGAITACSSGDADLDHFTSMYNALFVTVTQPTIYTFQVRVGFESFGECELVNDVVQITIIPSGGGPTPGFTVSCSPPSTTIIGGASTSFNLSTTGSGGYNSNINFTHSISPSSGTLPAISYDNNGVPPDATTIANILTTTSTTPAVYTITFYANGQADPDPNHRCDVYLTVRNQPSGGDIQCFDGTGFTNGPCTIANGATASLQWSSTNTTACTAPPSALTGTSGSGLTSSLTANSTFSLSCTDLGGNTSVLDTVDIIVGPPPLPLADIQCNGNTVSCTVPYGGSGTISWTSSFASSCTASSPNPPNFNVSGLNNTGASSGSITVNPTVFTLSCTGPGGTAQDTVTVNIAPSTADIRVNGSDTPAAVSSGSNVTVSWTSYSAATCSVTSTNPPNFTNSDLNNAGISAGPITANPTRFTINCTGPGGNSTDFVDVPVTTAPPTADIRVNGSDTPPAVTSGGNVTVSWTSGNTTTCTTTSTNPPNFTNSDLNNTGISAGPITANPTRFTINCTGPGGNSTDFVDVPVTTAPPTADIRVNGSDTPPAVTSGGNVTVSWTSGNTTTCTTTSTNPPNFTNSDLNNTGISAGPITVNPTRFTINCTGPGGNSTDFVDVPVTVPSPPYIDVACSPASLTITQNGTGAVNLSTTGFNGFSDPIVWSVDSFIPNPDNPTTPPTISFTNNNVPPNATTNAIISTNTGTSTGRYIIRFVAIGDTVPKYCEADLTVNPAVVVAPNPPTGVLASNSTCSVISLTWTAPSAGPTPDGYKIYRSPDGLDGYVEIGSRPYGTNTFPDTTAVVGSYYNYQVTSYIGAVESAPASATPSSITPTACSANISTSDKDLIEYEGNTSSGPTQNPCNFNPLALDTFVLPSNASFQAGKTAKFRISVCNTGTSTLTSLGIADVMTNATNPTSFSYSGCGAASQTITSASTISFSLGNLNPSAVCTITYNAVITAPSGPAAVYRFQNRANISAAGGITHSAYTLPYTFTINAGSPTRTETN